MKFFKFILGRKIPKKEVRESEVDVLFDEIYSGLAYLGAFSNKDTVWKKGIHKVEPVIRKVSELMTLLGKYKDSFDSKQKKVYRDYEGALKKMQQKLVSKFS